MTPQELTHAINEGLIKNECYKFWPEAIKKTGKKINCPTVYRAAWKMYEESMKDVPFPTTQARGDYHVRYFRNKPTGIH